MEGRTWLDADEAQPSSRLEITYSRSFLGTGRPIHDIRQISLLELDSAFAAIGNAQIVWSVDVDSVRLLIDADSRLGLGRDFALLNLVLVLETRQRTESNVVERHRVDEGKVGVEESLETALHQKLRRRKRRRGHGPQRVGTAVVYTQVGRERSFVGDLDGVEELEIGRVDFLARVGRLEACAAHGLHDCDSKSQARRTELGAVAIRRRSSVRPDLRPREAMLLELVEGCGRRWWSEDRPPRVR